MASYNGYVIIGFKADKKQLERDVKDIEKELRSYDKRRGEIAGKINDTQSNLKYYETEINKNKELIKVSDQLLKKRLQIKEQILQLQEVGSTEALIERNKKEKEYDETLAKYKEIKAEIKNQADATQEIVNKYEEAKANLQQWQSELTKIDNSKKALIEKTGQYKNELATMDAFQRDFQSRSTRSFNNVGKSMDKIIKKVAKWALAVFGVRSAYNAIRSAVSIISQYDEQLSTDLEYIRYSLAMVLKPLIEWIVKAVFQLLRYLQYFIYKLTGINIFANATADAFKKASNNAKDLKKQLAGFDEMNVLSDSASTSGTPSFNLGELGGNIDFNGMYDKAKTAWVNVKKIFFNGWDSIIAGITDKLKQWGISDDIISGVEATLKGVENIVRGAFDVIEGTIKFFIALWNVDLEGVKKAFSEIIGGLLTMAQGFVQFMLGQIGTFIGTIRDLIKGIWNWITSAFKDGSTSVSNSFSSISGVVDGVFKKIGQLAQTAWNTIKNVFGNVANWFGNIFGDAWNRVKNIFSTGGKIFDGIKEGIENSFKNIVNKLIDGINKVVAKPFEKINEMLNKIHDVNILGLKPFSNLWNNNPISIPKIPKLRTGAILNMPGKGVYHNGAFVGDGGAEGILPLTDKSAMELLGRTIGEYVTINANITNNMNGRLISRILQEVKAQQDFLYNK